jgi:hypothetical protein
VPSGSADEVTQYWASNEFPTKDEAIQECIRFGKLIIDGEITPEKSVI